MSSALSIEEQRFMCSFGLRQWGEGVIFEATELDRIVSSMPGTDYPALKREFERRRHYFLIACNKLVDYIEWARDLNFINVSVFASIEPLSEDMKRIRGLNEHVIEYFRGSGKYPAEWTAVDAQAIADVSSTVGSKIGNRLDWKEVKAAAQQMLAVLPPQYSPAA